MAQRKKAQSQRQNELADALRNTPDDTPTAGFRCGVERIRNHMNDETRALFDQRVAEIRARREVVLAGRTGGVNCSWLARVLNENGYPISALTVQKHVSKRCRCGT